ncbi:MAG: hypothetical protein QM479_13185 [Pseudomonadota bacterium]
MNKIIITAIALTLASALILINFNANNDASRTTAVPDAAPAIALADISRNSAAVDGQDLGNSGRMEKLAYLVTFETNGKINSSLFRAEYSIKGNDSGTIEVSSKLSAQLNIRLIVEEHERKFYFAKFGSFNNPGEISNLSKQQLSKPFAFYLNDNGSITLYENGVSYNQAMRNLLLQLLPYLQAVGTNESETKSETKWTTRESDLVGSYKAEYVADRSSDVIALTKHKLLYDSTNKLPSLFRNNQIAVQAQVVNSESKIKLEKNKLWPNEITLTERIRTESSGVIVSDMSINFTAQTTVFDAGIDMPGSLIDLKNLLAAKNNKVDNYKTDGKLSALVAGKNLDEMMAYYYEVFKENEFLAQKILINYLRLYPELSNAFVDNIYAARDKLTDSEEVKLWFTLAKAGHQEAQAAYIYALNNPDFKQIIQYRAIGHIRIFEQPTEQFVENLWALHKRLSATDTDTNKDNKVLAGGVLFAIATLSSSEYVDDKIKQDIVSTLANRLNSSNHDTEKGNLIIALGNTGNSSLLNNIFPYLDSDNSQLREDAFMALSRMPGDEATTAYMDAYDRVNADDQQMQFHALNNFNKRTMTNESIEWLSDKALQLNNATETKRLIKILGDNISTFPEVETTLRSLLTAGLSAKLKSDIYLYITPKAN